MIFKKTAAMIGNVRISKPIQTKNAAKGSFTTIDNSGTKPNSDAIAQ
jgi:hypothetical protein